VQWGIKRFYNVNSIFADPDIILAKLLQRVKVKSVLKFKAKQTRKKLKRK